MKAPSRLGMATTAIFWAIAFVPVAVVLTTPHLVVEDGGLHLSNAIALRGLVDGWFSPLLSWRPVLSPNMTVEILLAALTTVLSGDAALKLVVVVGLLGYALSIAALMRAVRLPIYFGMPLLAFQMHYFVMLGFLGFVWAVPLALATVAVGLRRPLNPPQVPLTLLLVATWFTHVVPALVATIAVTLIALFARLADHERPGKAIRMTLRTTAIPVAVMALMTLVWFLQTRSGDLQERPDPIAAAKNLLQFSGPLVAYAHVEYWLSRALAVAVYVVAVIVVVIRVRTRTCVEQLDGLIAAAALLAVLSVTLPEHSGSGAGFVAVRLTLFATLFLILWVCTQLPTLRGMGRIASSTMLAIAAVVAIAVPIVRIPELHRLSAEISQIGEVAPCLPVHSTIVQVTLDAGRGSSPRLSPMVEQTGDVAVSREALDLFDESGWFPFYVWRYTDSGRLDNYVTAGEHFDDVPTPIQLNAAIADGVQLTGVIVYGRAAASKVTLSEPAVRTVDQDLADDFRLVRTSNGGNAELWLRKGVDPSC
jgi:hypothetical protein